MVNAFRSKPRNAVGWLFLFIALSACTTYTLKHFEMHQRLASGRPDEALLSLEGNGTSNRDKALYELNKASLLMMLGRHEESNVLFESAKKRMEKLSATSITENVTSVMINEGTRSYAGQPYEQLLVHAYMALNYLMLDQVDSARVEVLQADVKIREWASNEDIEGIKASAFVRYLGGVVFEVNKEWSDALIAYRKAYEVYRGTERPVPILLQEDLLRLTDQQELKDEHQKYLEEFSRKDESSSQELQRKAEIIIVYHQGLVSPMHEQITFSYSADLQRSVQIALPFYEPLISYSPTAYIEVGQHSAKTELIESIDELARDNLEARLAGLTLRAVARAVVKKNLADDAQKENSFAGFLTNIAGIVTERADTRSWSTLPANIQIARIVVNPGEHPVRVAGVSLMNSMQGNLMVHLSPGQKKVLSVYSTQVH